MSTGVRYARGVPGPVVVEYDERWPGLAKEWAARIDRRLQELPGLARHPIQHIGSTAVPGLAAKAIIDLQVLVPAIPDEVALTEALVPLGLSPARGSRPDSPGVRFDIPRPSSAPDSDAHAKLLFHRPADAEGPEIILHVRRADSPFADFVVAFRDWLRASDDNARRYEHVKRELAAHHSHASDYDDYTRAKSDFLDRAQVEMGWPPAG